VGLIDRVNTQSKKYKFFKLAIHDADRFNENFRDTVNTFPRNFATESPEDSEEGTSIDTSEKALRPLFDAVRKRESAGDDYAVSKRGAFGPMGVVNRTARKPGLGVKRIPEEEIRKAPKDRNPEIWRDFGERYLTALLKRYDHVDGALRAYNMGLGDYDKWIEAGADPSKMHKDRAKNKEFQEYVTHVRRNLADPRATFLATSQEISPSQAAQNRTIAKATNISTNIVEVDPVAAKKQQQFLVVEDIYEKNPALSSVAENPENMKVIYDDLKEMVLAEQAAKNLSFADNVSIGVDLAQSIGFRFVEAFAQLIDDENLEALGREGAELNLLEAQKGGSGKQINATDIKSASDFLQFATQTIGTQGVMMTPSLLGGVIGGTIGIAGGPVGVAVGSALGTFIPSFILGVGEVQGEISDRGGEAPLFALGGGALIGLLDSALPGKVGSQFVKVFGREVAERVIKRTALTVMKNTAKDSSLEALTEGVQEVIGVAVAAHATDTEIDTEELTNQFINAMAAGAFFGGVVSTSTGTVTNIIKSERVQNKLDKMHRATKDTKTNEIAPDITAEHTEKILKENDVQSLEIDANALIDAAVATEGSTTETLENLGVVEEIDEALDAGETVTVQAENFAKILGQDLYDFIVGHVKLTKDNLTLSEAIEAIPNMAGDLTKQLIAYSANAETKERVAKMIDDFTSGNPLTIMLKAGADDKAILNDLINKVESEKKDISGTKRRGRIENRNNRLDSVTKEIAALEGEIERADGKGVKGAIKQLRKLKTEEETIVRELDRLQNPDLLDKKVSKVLGSPVASKAKVTTRASTLDKLNVRATKESVRATKKAFRAGFRTATNSISEIQNILIEAIDKSGIKDGLKKFKADIKKIKTLDKLNKNRGRIQERMARLLDAQRKKELQAAMKKIFNQYKVKRQSGKPVGKLTPDGQALVDRLSAAFKTSKVNAQQQLDANLFQGDTIDSAPDSATGLENMILLMRADPKLVNADAVESLLLSLQDIIAEERAINRSNALSEAVRVQKTIEDFNALSEVEGETEFQESVDGGPLWKRIGTLVKETIGTGFNGVWRSKLRRVMTSTNKALVDKMTDVTLSLFKEYESFRAGNAAMRSKLMAAMSEATGMSEKQLLKKILEDTHIEINLGKFSLTVQEGDKPIRSEIKLTMGQLRYLAMINRHPQLREVIQHAKSNGFTEDILAEVERHLSDTDNQIIEAQIKFYDEYYDGVNEVYGRLFNVNLPREDFYFPTKRKFDDNEAPDEFLKSTVWRGGITAKALKSRSPNVHEFIIDNDFTVFEAHLEEMEYFKAMAEKIRFLNSVFSSKNGNIMRDIGRRHGKFLVKSLKADLDYFASRGTQSSIVGEKLVRMITRNFAGVQLGAKLTIGAKQMASQFAFMEDVSAKDFLAGLIEFYKNMPAAYAFLNENSSFFRERGMGIDPDFQDFMKSNSLFNSGGLVTTRKWMFAAIQFGDKFAIAAGGYARYRAQIEAGMSHEQAIDDFGRIAERTQQSTSPDQLTALARGNAYMRILTMFMSSHNAMARAEAEGINEWRAGRIDNKEFAKRIFIYHFFIPSIIQIIVNGGQWDNDDQIQAGVLGSFGGLFMIGQVLEQAIVSGMNAVGYEQDYIRSDIFHPLQVFRILIDALNDLEKKGFMWEDFLKGSIFLDKLMDVTGIALGGIPIKQLAREGKGAIRLSSGEDTGAAVYELLGYSPYIIDNKLLIER